jgi:putative DNA primase/helicase
LWRLIARDGKETKPPYQANGQLAKTTDSRTWTSFTVAIGSYNQGGSSGVGFVLTKDVGIVGVDLDHCRNAETGDIEPWAQDIVERLDSYTEVSPSGTGLHIFLFGKLPKSRRKSANVEMYDTDRFLTVTGMEIGEVAVKIQDRQEEINRLHADVFGAPGPRPSAAEQPLPSSLSMDDDGVLEMARSAKNGDRFMRLWDGDTNGYPSPSEADLALCSYLSFYTGGDRSQVDRLFRRSNLFRTKWDERHHSDGQTYGDATITKALSGSDIYGPHPNGATPIGGLKASGDPAFEPPEYATPLTDLGNAERFVRDNADALRYVAPWKKAPWLEWYETRWGKDLRLHVVERAKKTVRGLYREAADIEDAKSRNGLLDHARKSEHVQRITAMVNLGASDPKLSVLPDQMDTDLLKLNVLNGTIDLRTGQLQPHSRQDLITKLAPVTYYPDAKCSLFEVFLNRIMGGNPKLIAYLQRVLGYCLSGDIREQAIWVFHGDGDNGKSTLMTVLHEILGDYATQPSIDTFLAHRSKSETQPGLMALAGVRMAVSTELEPGSRLSEDLIKRVTGGEVVTGRGLWEGVWSYLPAFKLILVVNPLPTIRGQDHAIWRRVKRVPFAVRIPKSEQDKNLSEKLKAEAPGVLAWLVQGCLDWQQGGLMEPEEVTQATVEYREEMDVLGDWMAESGIRTGDHLWEQASALYRNYKQWADESGARPYSQAAFGRMLTDRGYRVEKKRGIKIRHGLSFGEDC